MSKTIEKENLLKLLLLNLRYLQPDRYNNSTKKLKRFLIKNNIFKHTQILLNKKTFTQEELYIYLTQDNGKCKICNNKLKFLNFRGYNLKCIKCIENLKTKKDILKYLQNNWSSYAQILKPKNKNRKNTLIFKKINYNFKNYIDLYMYLSNDKLKKCRLKSCNNIVKFINIFGNHKDFCSLKCNNKWLSESRKGEKNPIHRISDENRKKWKQTLSNQVKQRIKDGTWTPNVTNSWCHSRYKIKFKRNNKIIEQKVRSSWEAFFQLLNINYLYEKLRIPYLYNDNWHNYIVDFINNDKKEVIEIKPKSEEYKEINIIKKNSLLKWCKNNNYTYISINEDYFKKIIWDKSILDDQPDKLKLMKFKKYFNEN